MALGRLSIERVLRRQVNKAVAPVEAESSGNTTAVADLLCVPTLAFCTDTITLFITFNLPPANTTLTPGDWTITIGGTPQTAATAACSGGVVTLTAAAGSFYPTSMVATSIAVTYDGTDATFVDQVGAGRAVPAFTGFIVLPRLDIVNSTYISIVATAVASLPAAGTAGRVAFASNGRKAGEGAGAGTGVLVYDDGTAWRRVDDGTTVAA